MIIMIVIIIIVPFFAANRRAICRIWNVSEAGRKKRRRRGRQKASAARKNQAFVFRGDFSTAAGQFSHFVYGRP